MIPRIYDHLEDKLQAGKVIVVYGPRRVGKTTIVNNLLAKTKLKYKFDSGDDTAVQEILGSQRFNQIIPYLHGLQLYVIDEAQHIPNIGMGLKIIVDQIPDLKVLVTGSSSLDLRGQIGEPLVGRKFDLTLYPVSHLELYRQSSPFDLIHKIMPEYLVFGGYPEVMTSESRAQKSAAATAIVNSYLLKDILEFERVKDSKTVRDLLKLIAFQIGSEVSLSEIGRKLNLDAKTVARYLDLLEKSFILYNLHGYSWNLRKEITTKSKYFFIDNGVRNAVINNFNDLSTRDDVGKLWENFLVIERLKSQHYLPIYTNNYFWRTWEQKEIDWVEERDGGLFAWEFKWSQHKKSRNEKAFLAAYPKAILKTVTPENYLDFLIKK
jgi:predicted AAA+ superfamily ATPase